MGWVINATPRSLYSRERRNRISTYIVRDFRFSQRCCWTFKSSGVWRRAVGCAWLLTFFRQPHTPNNTASHSRRLESSVTALWKPQMSLNCLTPNDPYMGRAAPLTSKRCILYIYSTNIGTEYFKHALYSPFFFLSSKCCLFYNANLFGSCIIHILYTGCAKIKKKKFPRQKVKMLLSSTKR